MVARVYFILRRGVLVADQVYERHAFCLCLVFGVFCAGCLVAAVRTYRMTNGAVRKSDHMLIQLRHVVVFLLPLLPMSWGHLKLRVCTSCSAVLCNLYIHCSFRVRRSWIDVSLFWRCSLSRRHRD